MRRSDSFTWGLSKPEAQKKGDGHNMVFSLSYMIHALRHPTVVVRLTDEAGRKKIVILERKPFSCKAVGKFEISQEFDPQSCAPDWIPIDFRAVNAKRKDGG